jgi:hypothetical protein
MSPPPPNPTRKLNKHQESKRHIQALERYKDANSTFILKSHKQHHQCFSNLKKLHQKKMTPTKIRAGIF